jgi:hypothetical protein
MSRQDDRARKRQGKKNRRSEKSSERRPNNQEQLNDAFGWFHEEFFFDDLQFHGNTSWNPKNLILLALVWSLSDKGTLTDAFTHAKA